ncbi:MAG: RNA-binding S4 domain-containing protein [Neisseriaceae bacterium]|nr:RNA-binding S4 domain-containing protein [Neisseriaceae bacterium]MBQ9620177.1 RNA-binding S4 domain-containing protein [Neisseriaceae bacterium]
MKQIFVLQQPHIELCQLLKITGIANSGGQAKMMIADQMVLRNGNIETRKTAKIGAGETIIVQLPDGDRKIEIQSPISM